MGLKKGKPTPETDIPGERHQARDLDGLLQALHADEPMARRWAARDLAAHPEATADLVKQLRREPENSVRQVILSSLTNIGNEAAIQGLIDCLYLEDAMLRNAAIDVLKELPDQVAPFMGRLLQDPDPDVRIFAVDVLESLRHPRVEEWLIEVISQDAHVNVCATAVDLLGEVGSDQAKTALLSLKQRFADEPYIQFAADLALKRIEADGA
ncbi:HEAT repeat domain-containing protein [Halochromatium roseum]|uniref:HEAT repeat domain-containing protein n=1 Tax=Halochromatium roseum TaxID=391920 RepID=UPI00191156A4|nr:HEAT repeat domain-containing protein [Halochromatium roseum]MBK5941534.1 PBS lyase [Halochromatium roseum]